MDPTCNSFVPSQPIMTDCTLRPRPPTSYAGFAPTVLLHQKHEATYYQLPHSPNTEANWIEHYKAQAQKSEQECVHYQKLYERVSDQNQSLRNHVSILQQKIRKQEELDQQLSNKEELAEKLQLEAVQLRIDRLRIDNTSLKDEGTVLKKAIARIRDKEQVEILNFKLDQLYIDNALEKAEVVSSKKPIAEVQEEKYMDTLNLELNQLHTDNTLLKAEATLLQQEIAEAREEARKERVDHGHLEFEIMKRDRKIAAFDRIVEARVEAESKLDRAESMIINLQEEIERACSNYGKLERDLVARNKLFASIQNDMKNAEARAGSLQRSLDTAEMGLRALKAGFEIKYEELELHGHLTHVVACPIRRRDINFSYRKEDQRSKEAVKGGNRAAHDPNFVADAILCYFECLTDRDMEIATRIFGEALEVHATSLEDLHRLMRRTRFVDWLNSRATIRSWMKEKKHNGTSKRADRFRELDKQLVDLSSSIASLHSEEDEFHTAFETDPRVEAKLAELRTIAVIQERTRKPSH